MLERVVSPPGQPVAACSASDWDRIEVELAIQFPSDYRRLVSSFGSGYFCGTFIFLPSPASARYSKVVDTLLYQLSAAKGHGIPYNVFPVTPGLYPWATDENGGIACWNRVGDPDDWNVVTVSAGPEYDVEELECGAESFLVNAFTNEIACDLWREPFDVSELTFTARPEPQVK